MGGVGITDDPGCVLEAADECGTQGEMTEQFYEDALFAKKRSGPPRRGQRFIKISTKGKRGNRNSQHECQNVGVRTVAHIRDQSASRFNGASDIALLQRELREIAGYDEPQSLGADTLTKLYCSLANCAGSFVAPEPVLDDGLFAVRGFDDLRIRMNDKSLDLLHGSDNARENFPRDSAKP